MKLAAYLLLALNLYGVASEQKKIPLYQPGNRELGWKMGRAVADDPYLDEVQPLLSARCVSCHGCYEAPCQLNMQSYQGVRRGYHEENFYATHVGEIKELWKEIKQDEMFVHPNKLKSWRDLGYLPVVTHASEFGDDTKIHWKNSMMSRFVKLGEKNVPNFDLMALEKTNQQFIDDSKQVCVSTADQFNRKTAKDKNHKTVWFDHFVKQYPNAGMPFALPKLEANESELLNRWMQEGSEGPDAKEGALARSSRNPAVIQKWEDFLNTPTNKGKIIGRYIYEHSFSAKYAFDEIQGETYEIVRAANKTGPIAKFTTERPYDGIGNQPFYYRLQKVTYVPVQKTQILWYLNDARLAHLKAQFGAPWPNENPEVPGYGVANPFENFAAIPAAIRAKFMQENSSMLVGGMVQGSVCVGSRPTYAIRDHFWGFFLDPAVDPSVQNPLLGLDGVEVFNTERNPWQPHTLAGRALLKTINAIDMGSLSGCKLVAKVFKKATGFDHIDEDDSTTGAIVEELRNHGMTTVEILSALHHFLRSTDDNQAYQEAFEKELRKLLRSKGRKGLAVSDIWNGSGDSSYEGKSNPNAWLNITRHGKSATVQYGGKEGGRPQTIWILSYSNFERLYYNLVVSFKSWGNIPHKLATWRHMSYVRLEGEDLAISLLPAGQLRDEVRKSFTRGMVGETKQAEFFPHWANQEIWENGRPLGIVRRKLKAGTELMPARPAETPGVGSMRSADAAIEFLVKKTEERLAAVHARPGSEKNLTSDEQKWEDDLLSISKVSVREGAEWARYMPEIGILHVVRPEGAGDSVWTIHTDRGYKAHNFVFGESINRDEQYDELSFYRGTVGAYPNAFFRVSTEKREEFIADIHALRSEADAKDLLKKWAVARNSAAFWPEFDWLHAWKSVDRPENVAIEQGVLDVSQYSFF